MSFSMIFVLDSTTDEQHMTILEWHGVEFALGSVQCGPPILIRQLQHQSG